MASSIINRTAVRGGYGALIRGRVTCSQWGASRAFSATSRAQEKLYSKDHEWIEYSADKKSVTLGVSTFAAKNLGDVVYVELPTIGTEVEAGESIGVVESVKSASELYSPVGGTVSEANSVLEEKPSLINKSPEGEAWIARLDVTGQEDSELMTEEQYKSFTEEADS